MAQRKPFLLRIPEELLDELNRWAKDELRSVNAQVEYLLRDAVRRRRRDRAGPDDLGDEGRGDDDVHDETSPPDENANA